MPANFFTPSGSVERLRIGRVDHNRPLPLVGHGHIDRGGRGLGGCGRFDLVIERWIGLQLDADGQLLFQFGFGFALFPRFSLLGPSVFPPFGHHDPIFPHPGSFATRHPASLAVFTLLFARHVAVFFIVTNETSVFLHVSTEEALNTHEG